MVLLLLLKPRGWCVPVTLSLTLGCQPVLQFTLEGGETWKGHVRSWEVSIIPKCRSRPKTHKIIKLPI